MATASYVKQTQVWTKRPGTVSITVFKQKVMPNGMRKDVGAHRITLEPTDDVLAVVAMNNANLVSIGYPAIDPSEIDLPLALRQAVMEAAPEPTNPVTSVEINADGGMRLTITPQYEIDGELHSLDDDPEYVFADPFDDVGAQLIKHNFKMEKKGSQLTGFDEATGDPIYEPSPFLPVLDKHMNLAKKMRKAALDHPMVKASVQQQAVAIQAELTRQQLKEATAEVLREQRRAEEAAAEAERQRLAQERLAQAEERRKAEIAAMIDAAVAKREQELKEKGQ